MNLAKCRLDKKRIRTIFKSGKSFSTKAFKIRAFADPEKISRVGFVIKKKTGPAVKRNNLRRIFRACFFEFSEKAKEKYWIMFEVYPHPVSLSRKEIRKEVFAILRAL